MCDWPNCVEWVLALGATGIMQEQGASATVRFKSFVKASVRRDVIGPLFSGAGRAFGIRAQLDRLRTERCGLLKQGS